MSYQDRMTGSGDFEDIKERPSWLIPLVLFGITLIFGFIVWWAYFGLSLDDVMGNNVSGTERGRILHVSIGGQPLEIPENFTQYPKDRKDGERSKIELFTILPDFEPYSAARHEDFMGNAPDSPVVHFEIASHPIARTESERAQTYMDLVQDPKGEMTKHGLMKYHFEDVRGFRDQDMFLFKTAKGLTGMLRCLRESDIMATPFCTRDTELGNGLSLRYRFRRAHLKHWNAIDRGVLELVETFVRGQRYQIQEPR